MINGGINVESVTPLLAKARKAERVNVVEEVQNANKIEVVNDSTWGSAEKKRGVYIVTQVKTARNI